MIELMFSKRGYLFAFFSSICIAILGALKYSINWDLNTIDYRKLGVLGILNFVVFFSASFFLAKWYYKLNKKNRDN